jgi:ATP-dependent DNA helicase RecQ
VGLQSSRHPALIRTLAAQIAKVGRLPLLGAVATAPVGGRANSAHRVRSLLDVVSVPPELAVQLAELNGPVLLVDDYVDSGWTMAIAARALRQAGATAVLPLALGLGG